MCVIIVDPSGKGLTRKMVEKAMKENPHGYGRVDLTDGSIIRISNKSQIEKIALTPCRAIHHFRYASVGGISEANIHPFAIDDREVLFMNGTVREIATKTNETDTQAIARMLSLVPQFRRIEALEFFSARFVIADRWTGDFRLSGKWIEQGGLIMSNNSVLAPIRIAVYGTLKKKHGNHGYLRNADFIGNGVTKEKHRLPAAEYVPRVYKGTTPDGRGHQIAVEVYDVGVSDLESIDRLEGHPTNYKREVIQVVLESGETTNAFMYFGANEWNDANKDLVDKWERQTGAIKTFSFSDGYWNGNRFVPYRQTQIGFSSASKKLSVKEMLQKMKACKFTFNEAKKLRKLVDDDDTLLRALNRIELYVNKEKETLIKALKELGWPEETIKKKRLRPTELEVIRNSMCPHCENDFIVWTPDSQCLKCHTCNTEYR